MSLLFVVSLGLSFMVSLCFRGMSWWFVGGGLKIHHEADPARIAAGASLCAKGLTTLPDGGYLTPLGMEAAEHAQSAVRILSASID